MNAYLGHLDAARDALVHADPARCAREIAAFEVLCIEQPPQGADIPACQMRLRALGSMAAACAEGINSARQDLQDALIAAGRLTTYDAVGARATRDTRNAQGHKF